MVDVFLSGINFNDTSLLISYIRPQDDKAFIEKSLEDSERVQVQRLQSVLVKILGSCF